MAFSYDPATTLGKIRLAIGDTIAGKGVKPDGANLQDEEITALVGSESMARAVPVILRALAAMYASYVDVNVGDHSERYSTTADKLLLAAEQWEQQTPALWAGVFRYSRTGV